MKRHTAFTLIELLVVVAIIVALLAILLPSMNKALALANRTVCVSNLKQVGIGFGAYHFDHRGVFYQAPSGDPHHAYWFWGGVTMDWDYGYLPASYNKTTNPHVRGINPYLPQDNPVYICPDDPEGDTKLWAPFGVDPLLTSTKAYYSTTGTSYQYNAETLKRGIKSIAALKNPSLTYAINEWPAFDVMSIGTRPSSWTDLPRWSLHDNDGVGALPYEQSRNGISTVFFDGHADYVFYETSKWDTPDYSSGNP